MPLDKKLIARIREHMSASGISTIQELSERSGVRRATLSEILNGNVATVKLNTLEGIAKAFKCSVSSLLQGIY